MTLSVGFCAIRGMLSWFHCCYLFSFVFQWDCWNRVLTLFGSDMVNMEIDYDDSGGWFPRIRGMLALLSEERLSTQLEGLSMQTEL